MEALICAGIAVNKQELALRQNITTQKDQNPKFLH